MIKDVIEKLKSYFVQDKELVWYRRKSVQILVLFMLLLAGGVLIVNSAHKNNATVEELDDTPRAPIATVPEDGNAAIAPDDVEIVTASQNNEEMVTISMEDTGRADPFLPAGDFSQIAALSTPNVNKMPYYMIPPPDASGYDQDAVDVVKTKVSGIMYDKYNPSAILNIDDTDYLVRAGDVVNGYRVLAVSPTTVTVQLGANTYRAGVGEMFSGEDMNYVNDGFGRARRRW